MDEWQTVLMALGMAALTILPQELTEALLGARLQVQGLQELRRRQQEADARVEQETPVIAPEAHSEPEQDVCRAPPPPTLPYLPLPDLSRLSPPRGLGERLGSR